ncbi:MAG: IclR family transcriptional regulator [Candidatus Dormibacteria bacterium]
MKTATRSGGEQGSFRGLGSVRKCLQLVEILAFHGEPVRLSDLARQLETAPSSMHQRLVTLVEARWAEQTPDGRYRLSQRLAILGMAALDQVNLGSTLRLHMHELAQRTQEGVDLSVLDGCNAVVVQQIESSEALRAQLSIGRRLPLARSAAGNVLVAYAAPHVLSRLRLGGVELPEDSRLEQIRNLGAAIVMDDFVPSISAASAPIFDADGHAAAALSLTVPTCRFDPSHAISEVLATTREVNAGLNLRHGHEQLYSFVRGKAVSRGRPQARRHAGGEEATA